MENEKKFTGPAYEFEAKMPLKQAIPLGLRYPHRPAGRDHHLRQAVDL